MSHHQCQFHPLETLRMFTFIRVRHRIQRLQVNLGSNEYFKMKFELLLTRHLSIFPLGTTYYMTASQQSITTNSSSATTNVPLNTTMTASYAPQAGPFAVVPASNRGVVTSSTSSAQSNPVPVRFNPPLIVDGNTHNISKQQQEQPQHQGKQTHMLLPGSGAKASGIIASPRAQQTIVAAPSRKTNSINLAKTQQPQPSWSGPAVVKSAVKNLNPTLIALGSESMASIQTQRATSPPISRPGSSDGSTTVSATSSPGIDQQEQEEFNALSAMHRNNRNIGDGAQFKNVDNLFAAGQTVNVPQMQANSQAAINSYQSSVSAAMSSTTIAPNSNGGNTEELTPRKRARKQQLSDYAGPQNTKKYQVSGSGTQTADSSTGGGSIDSDCNTFGGNASNASSTIVDNANANKNTDASIKSVDFVIKKPRTCTLLDVSETHKHTHDRSSSPRIASFIHLSFRHSPQGYKQTWKATNNHFQRYSDVKPREERRPTVVDLANQSHVLQKVNGWKIYHLSSQMEDLVSSVSLSQPYRLVNFILFDFLPSFDVNENRRN